MKITLKNGETVTIKRIRAKDYEAVMTLCDRFSLDTPYFSCSNHKNVIY